jgi:hypothetical protein
MLVPLLFSVLEFGSALERWLAQDAATVQAARYAGELGGDAPELRNFLAGSLRAAGIDPARVSVDVAPSRVGWRELGVRLVTARAAKMGPDPRPAEGSEDPSGSEADSRAACSGQGRDEDEGQQVR